MANETKSVTVAEVIPSAAGRISGLASADAPFVYFEDAVFFGLLNGIGKVTLQVSRNIALDASGQVVVDRVLVAHLVGNLAAIRSLRAALDGILLMAEPAPEGSKN